MKIAVTGANGFIGQHVVEDALAKNHDVVALVRESTPGFWQDESRLTTITGDQHSSEELAGILAGCDCVIHLAATIKGPTKKHYHRTLNSTRNVLQALDKAGINQLIGVSSIAVLNYIKQKPMSVIDENTPLHWVDDELGPYAKMKRDQEQLYREWAADDGKYLSIFRLGQVYDREYLTPAHVGFLSENGDGLAALHRGFVPLVHVNNVSSALVLATQYQLRGETFHLVDDNLPKQREYLRILRRYGSIKNYVQIHWRTYAAFAICHRTIMRLLKRIDTTPDSVRRNSVAARLKPFRFSNDKAKKLLHWQPEYSILPSLKSPPSQ